MKNEMKYGVRKAGLFKLLVALAFFFILHPSSFILSARAQGNVGIGTISPDSSALLDLTSITRGLLIPRMTQCQRSAIASPATGLLVFCTDTICAGDTTPSTFYYYNGTAWVTFAAASWTLFGNSGTSPARNYLGTQDSQDFVIRADNLEHLRVFAGGNVGLTNTNNTAEELRFFAPSDSFYTGFKAGVQPGSVTYTLPPGDGLINGNQVLCTNGAGTLSWLTFGNGGNDTLWSRGSGTLALVGHGLANVASGVYSISAGDTTKATGSYSVAFGLGNLASGTASAVSGGAYDTASGQYSDVGGGQYNTAGPGNYSSVGGGDSNKATGLYSVVVGGLGNSASGNYSTSLGGTDNKISGNYSLAFGQNANVTQDNSVVFYSSAATMKVGIGNVNPAQALDITGSLKFSGALMPTSALFPGGNPGFSGQVLASTGANSAPSWTTASGLYWSTLGNTGTSPSTNYLGTSDTNALVFRTDDTERMRILSTGQVGINVVPGAGAHQLQSLYTGTTDETAAIFGNATGTSATYQAIGVWGAASNPGFGNTGTIGVLATGNGNAVSHTNVALQLNDGEFTMGRTTETNSGHYTPVEPAAIGTAYSAQGPSGVIELALDSVNLNTTHPDSLTFQNLGTVTVNNRYCAATSIVIVNVVTKFYSNTGPDNRKAEYFVDVDNRATGTFDIRVGMIPTITSASNYTTTDYIKIGYVIINPGR